MVFVQEIALFRVVGFDAGLCQALIRQRTLLTIEISFGNLDAAQSILVRFVGDRSVMLLIVRCEALFPRNSRE